MFRFNPEDHAGLVYKSAMRWKWTITSGAIEFEDLIQAGNLGLAMAASKFKPELGYKFMTYAMYWVNEYIKREALDKCNTVRRSKTSPVSIDKLPEDTAELNVDNIGMLNLDIEDKKDLIASAIDNLPEPCAEVIRCKFFRDMNLTEMARSMGIKKSQAKEYLVQAVKLLQKSCYTSACLV